MGGKQGISAAQAGPQLREERFMDPTGKPLRGNRRGFTERRSQLTRIAAICIVLTGMLLVSLDCYAIQQEAEDVSPGEFEPTRDIPFDDLMYKANFIMNRDMDAAERIGDPDHDFVSLLLPHSKGALNMARVLLVYGTDKEIRELAQTIMTRQQNEMLFMQDWLKRHEAKESTKGGRKKKDSFRDGEDKAVAKMRNDLREVFRVMRTEDFDHEFVNVMIPQRKCAVDLARAFVPYGKDPEILDLAKKISEEQQAEIRVMERWLQRHKQELPH